MTQTRYIQKRSRVISILRQAFSIIKLQLKSRKLVAFRIENISHWKNIETVYHEFANDPAWIPIILTRDPDVVIAKGLTDRAFHSRLYPLLFRYELFIGTSQRMRSPLWNRKSHYLIPYGHFAKGISLARFRVTSFPNAIVPGYFAKSYLNQYLPFLNVIALGYPKADLYYKYANAYHNNKILIAPSYDRHSAIWPMLNGLVDVLSCACYSVAVKAHPMYFSIDSEFKSKIDELQKINSKAHFITDDTPEWNPYSVAVVITDYSSIAYEALSVKRGVVIIWSPKFYEEFLPKFYPEVSIESVINDIRINAGLGIVPAITGLGDVLSAVDHEIEKSKMRDKLSTNICNNMGVAGNAIADYLKHRSL